MEKAQESAAEAETQGKRGLRLKEEGRGIQLQLLQGIPEVRVTVGICRVYTAVHHGRNLLVARQRLCTGAKCFCHRIADSCLTEILDAGGKVAHHAAVQGLIGDKLARAEVADLHDIALRAGGTHLHLHALPDGAVLHPDKDDDALVRVIDRVKDQCLQRGLRVAGGCRQLRHDILQHLVHIQAGLGGNPRGIRGIQADDILYLGCHLIRMSAGKVCLVQYREYLQVMIQGQVYIGQGLGLHALGGIHHQDRAVAGSEASGNFIIKVHVSGGVNQIQDIFIAILCLVDGPDRLGLDGYAPLPLQIHVVQDLVLHLPAGEKSRHLDDTVRQRGFAVVDMGDDTEISYFGLVCRHELSLLSLCIPVIPQENLPCTGT